MVQVDLRLPGGKGFVLAVTALGARLLEDGGRDSGVEATLAGPAVEPWRPVAPSGQVLRLLEPSPVPLGTGGVAGTHAASSTSEPRAPGVGPGQGQGLSGGPGLSTRRSRGSGAECRLVPRPLPAARPAPSGA